MRSIWSLAFVVAGIVLPACAEVDDTGTQEAEILAKTNQAWQLNAGNDEGGNAVVTVSHTNANGQLVIDGTCQAASCPFALLDGTVVHIQVSPVDDAVNCELFHHWTGACAGQGASCTITIHSNVTTEAIYTLKRGCSGS